jgi:hypothetical protein
MRKTDKKREKGQSTAGQFRFPFHGLAREALWETVVLSGFGFVRDEQEAERTVLCGERNAHREHREAARAGHVPSSLVLGGRRVESQRPRARAPLVTNCGCRAGRRGVHMIRWMNALSSSRCQEFPPGAMHACWNHCLRSLRFAASAGARSANGS